MAVGASVTWTHCSVLFEVTWGKTRRVRVDALRSARTRARPHERDHESARTHSCPRGRSLASARTWASARMHLRPFPPSLSLPSPPPSPSLPSAVHVDAGLRPRGRGEKKKEKKKKKKKILFLFFLVVVAGLEREKKNFTIYNLQFSVFGFQSPKSPTSAGSAGEAARRRRFFRPSSPSHPSKLYSSLGWLNSKVPKPSPPFSLRLIDVDGF
jgi:hypothetical protein